MIATRFNPLGRRGTPYAYKVEYLESTGTQYIDTGINPHSTTKVECDANWTMSSTGSGSENPNPTLFGSRNTLPLRMYEVLQGVYNALYYQYGGSSPAITHGYGVRNIFFTDKNKLYIDGVLKITDQISTFSIDYPIALFALNQGGSINRFCKAKVYGFKIWQDGVTLTSDYIPVVDKQGVACMYDRVSGEFFYNQGTGEFIAGPRI